MISLSVVSFDKEGRKEANDLFLGQIKPERKLVYARIVTIIMTDSGLFLNIFINLIVTAVP